MHAHLQEMFTLGLDFSTQKKIVSEFVTSCLHARHNTHATRLVQKSPSKCLACQKVRSTRKFPINTHMVAHMSIHTHPLSLSRFLSVSTSRHRATKLSTHMSVPASFADESAEEPLTPVTWRPVNYRPVTWGPVNSQLREWLYTPETAVPAVTLDSAPYAPTDWRSALHRYYVV